MHGVPRQEAGFQLTQHGDAVLRGLGVKGRTAL